MTLVFRTIFLIAVLWVSVPGYSATPSIDINQTVIKMALEEGISMDDAVDSMKLRANTLNFKLVAHQPLSEELKAQGVESKRMEIFQFCDARIANEMVIHDMNFAAYLPCRIALVEDQKGKPWLIMMNLDLFIKSAELPAELNKKAAFVRDTLKSIMEAGASGDL